MSDHICMYWRKKPQLEIFFGEMKNGSIIPFIKNTISKNLNGTQVIVIAQGHLAIMPCYAHYVKWFKKVQPPEHCYHSVSAKFLVLKTNYSQSDNEYQKKIRKIKTLHSNIPQNVNYSAKCESNSEN